MPICTMLEVFHYTLRRLSQFQERDVLEYSGIGGASAANSNNLLISQDHPSPNAVSKKICIGLFYEYIQSKLPHNANLFGNFLCKYLFLNAL